MSLSYPFIRLADGTEPTQMSDEDAEHLKAAIREAVSQMDDPCAATADAATKLKADLKAKDTKGVMTALAVFETTMEHNDVCRNLHKLGAIDPCLEAVWYNDNAVADKALKILAFCLAHNPVLQREVHARDGLSVLFNRTDSYLSEIVSNERKPTNKKFGIGSLSPTTLMKKSNGNSSRSPSSADMSAEEPSPPPTIHLTTKRSLGCMAQLIRHIPEIEKEFVQAKRGMSLLTKALGVTDSGVQEKAASLAWHLLTEGLVDEATVMSSDLTSAIEALLSRRDINTAGIQAGEIAATLAEAFATQHGAFLKKNQAKGDQFRKAVARRTEYLSSLPKTSEEEDIVTFEMVTEELNTLENTRTAKK